jgi:hypothetical protein
MMVCASLVGCSEQGFSTSGWDADARAQILVSPREIVFGDARPGDPQLERFTIANDGNAVLHIEDLELPPGDFAILTDFVGMQLQPGGTRDIDVAFEPASEEDASYGVITVVSDDEDDGRIPVYLSGNRAFPDLEINPVVYDFGTPGVGCELTLDVQLLNVGGDDLVIDALSYEAGADLYLEAVSLPITLAPGQDLELALTYTPTDVGPRDGVLTVASNDPSGVETATQLADALLGEHMIEQFVVPMDPPVDLVFAIDHSCSMWDDAEDLGDNFGTFIDEIDAITNEWQAAVVTRDDGCFDTVVDRDVEGYEGVFAGAVAVPTGNQGPGSVGDMDHDLTEALIHITRNGFEAMSSGGCNEGFMRDGVLTHIVFVSDEPDQSPEGWATLTGELLTLTEELRMSAVAGPYPGGCDSADAGDGYFQATEATGGSFLSICEDWGGTVDGLADATIEALFSFRLEKEPVVDSIIVLIDGEIQKDGWWWDEVNNSVVFDDRVPGSTTVTVTYTELLTCDT